MSEAPPCEYGARCTPDDPCGLHEAQAAPPSPSVEKGATAIPPVGDVVTQPEDEHCRHPVRVHSPERPERVFCTECWDRVPPHTGGAS